MDLPSLGVSEDQIEEFCRRHHIRKLSLFGSVIRSDFRTDSDVDVLVAFDPDLTPGFEFFTVQSELSHLLGRHVDLNTPRSLSDHFRHDVIEPVHVCYDETKIKGAPS